MTEELPICQQLRELHEGSLPYWRPLREARRAEIDFLDGDRYVDDKGPYNKDRRRQQFRGQQISNVARNKAAQVTAAPRSIEARPTDRMSDPDDSEAAVALMEWETGNPQKCFDNTLDEVVQDAVETRAGCMMLDFDPDLGPWGETYWRWKDPNLIMFEPGFSDPHHIACGWMSELRRMRVDDVKAMGNLKGKAKWHGTEHVVGDTSAMAEFPGEASTQMVERLGVPGATIDMDHVWVWFWWFKNDRSMFKRQKDEQELPEGQRYMGCDNPECGYRSDTQESLLEQGKLGKGEELPDEMDPCPMCGGHLSRRDMRAVVEDVLAYPRGRRLVIMPALQQLPDDEPFYDDAWPVPARSFPIFWLSAYVKGGRPMGDSDTTRNWDAQLAADQLLTMAFDRIMRHQTYYTVPATGATDVNGKRFEFRDDQLNVIVMDYSNANVVPPKIEMVMGASLDPAFGQYWSAVNEVLLGPQGINDMGLTPDSSKDIAASTVAQLDRMGNIPVAHLTRRKNRALSEAYGVHWDYLRYTYTADRLARLQMEGMYILDKLRGDDLPNFDFVVEETPPFTGLEKARLEAAQALFQMADTNPGRLDVFAAINQFPPSIVRQVKAQMRREQEAAMAQGMAMPQQGMSMPSDEQVASDMQMVPQMSAPQAPAAPLAA